MRNSTSGQDKQLDSRHWAHSLVHIHHSQSGLAGSDDRSTLLPLYKLGFIRPFSHVSLNADHLVLLEHI